MNIDADDTDKSDASTHKPDDFTRSTRKALKRLPAAVVGKPPTTLTDTKTGDEPSAVRTRSPAEPQDIKDSVSADVKVASAKPKATRQRMTEIGRVPKSSVGKMKPGGSAGRLGKKTGTTEEKKQPGRPVGGLKMEEKYIKKKLLLEKKAAGASPVDVKRTGTYVLVEKVDSVKEDKPSAHKRVGVCCVFCD